VLGLIIVCHRPTWSFKGDVQSSHTSFCSLTLVFGEEVLNVKVLEIFLQINMAIVGLDLVQSGYGEVHLEHKVTLSLKRIWGCISSASDDFSSKDVEVSEGVVHSFLEQTHIV